MQSIPPQYFGSLIPVPIFYFYFYCICPLLVFAPYLLFTTHTAGEMDPVFATLRAASGLRRPNRGYSETGSDLALEFGPDEYGDNSASLNMSPVYSSRDFPRWNVKRKGLKRTHEGDKVEIIDSAQSTHLFPGVLWTVIHTKFSSALNHSCLIWHLHVWFQRVFSDALFFPNGLLTFQEKYKHRNNGLFTLHGNVTGTGNRTGNNGY